MFQVRRPFKQLERRRRVCRHPQPTLIGQKPHVIQRIGEILSGRGAVKFQRPYRVLFNADALFIKLCQLELSLGVALADHFAQQFRRPPGIETGRTGLQLGIGQPQIGAHTAIPGQTSDGSHQIGFQAGPGRHRIAGVVQRQFLSGSRQEIQITRQRVGHPRLLPLLGRGQHLIADVAKQHAHFQFGLFQGIQQGGGKGAVVRALAIFGHLTRALGIGDQRAARRGHRGQPANPAHTFIAIFDLGAACQVYQLGQRVVAATVQNDHPDLARAIDRIQHIGQRHGIAQHILAAGNPCIDRDQEILSLHLDAMPGIIDDGDICGFGAKGKAGQFRQHLFLRQVDHGCHIEV